jgi:hypothetical protein
MGVDDPDFDAAESILLAIRLESQNGCQVHHAADAETDHHAAGAAARLHHGADQVSADALEVGIAGHRLDLVGDVVMLEQAREGATCAERIGLEGDQDKHGRGEGVARVLQVQVELGYERAR